LYKGDIEVKITRNFKIVLMVSLILTLAFSGTVYGIKNGVPDEDNDWPYVCWVVLWDGFSEFAYLCSGSAIEPDVVLCAGHCTSTPGIMRVFVSFELAPTFPPPEVYDIDSEEWIEAEDWYTHPLFEMGAGKKGITDWITHDVGLLVLGEEVELDRYAELPSEYQVDTLPMMQDLDIVGYGVHSQIHGGGPPVWDYTDSGYRCYSMAQLIQGEDVISEEYMRVTANPGKGKGGTCYGDSGGPILLSGTDTVLGVCSWGPNGNCAGVSYEQRVDLPEILSWIESYLN
jgi:hypothetical protein